MKDLAILVKARESYGPWRNWKFFKNPHLTYYGRLTMLGVWTPPYTEEEHQTKSLKKLFLWLLFFRGGERYSWGDLKYVWLTSVLKTSNISFRQRWLMKLKCEDECSRIKKAIDFLIMEPSGHGPVGGVRLLGAARATSRHCWWRACEHPLPCQQLEHRARAVRHGHWCPGDLQGSSQSTAPSLHTGRTQDPAHVPPSPGWRSSPGCGSKHIQA